MALFVLLIQTVVPSRSAGIHWLALRLCPFYCQTWKSVALSSHPFPHSLILGCTLYIVNPCHCVIKKKLEGFLSLNRDWKKRKEIFASLELCNSSCETVEVFILILTVRDPPLMMGSWKNDLAVLVLLLNQ